MRMLASSGNLGFCYPKLFVSTSAGIYGTAAIGDV